MNTEQMIHELRTVLSALQTSYRLLESPAFDRKDLLEVQHLAMQKIVELISELEGTRDQQGEQLA